MIKIYIQSKSGDFNEDVEISAADLSDAMCLLRRNGGYYADDFEKFIPFEEIEHIRLSRN